LIAALREAFKKNNDVAVVPSRGKVNDGIRKVQDALRVRDDGTENPLAGLTVDPSCIHAINEFETYAYKDDKDEPIKEFDHAMDEIRYFITRARIQKIATQVRY